MTRADPLGDVRPQLGHGGELGALGRPLVGRLGQLLDLDVLDEDPERNDLVAVARSRRGEGQDVAGLGAAQLLVELDGDGAAAHFVEIVVDTDHLGAALVVPVEVDGDQVTVDSGAPDQFELRVVLPQAIDLAVDVLILDDDAGQGHLQAVVAGNGHRRTNLDDCVEADRPAVLPCGDVDVR